MEEMNRIRDPMVPSVDERVRAFLAGMTPEARASMEEDLKPVLALRPESVADLCALLVEPHSEEIRSRAAWLLGRIGDRRTAASPLAAALRQEPSEDVRGVVAEALGLIGGKRAVNALLGALRLDDAAYVRANAARSLGFVEPSITSGPLVAVVRNEDEDAEVRGSALEGLAEVWDEDASEGALAALGDPSAEVRFWAAFALGEAGDPSVISALEDVARSDSGSIPRWGSVRQEAAAAIERIVERSAQSPP